MTRKSCLGWWKQGCVAGLVLELVACGNPQPASEQSKVAAPLEVGGGGKASRPPNSSTLNGSTAVTLITGDRVFVHGPNAERFNIVPGPGREGIRFSTHRVPDASGKARHLYVFPTDALPLLAQDRVDRRLFDVMELIRSRYDDAHRSDLPLIVTYASAGLRATARSRALPGAVIDTNLPSVDGMAVRSAKSDAALLWDALSGGSATATARAATEPVGKVWLDGLRSIVLDRSTAQVGAPAAWSLGYEGNGVRVAVIDSGVDATHPDLSDAVVASSNFVEGPDVDDVGHGTHVASIIAGSGEAEGGRYRGVAPGAELVSGKVCVEWGCPESSMIAGMQWAVMEQGAKVVNLSIGGGDWPEIDPVEAAVNALTSDFGALFVTAAGNWGPGEETVESPASAELALAVGATDREGFVAEFSARGLRVGDRAVKPELVAPGVGIVAARAAEGFLGDPVSDDYVAMDGTSMAAPHVAGVAALLLEQHPEWSAGELKAALMGSAAFNPVNGVAEQGAGQVDVAAAVATSLFAEPPSASFGVATFPYEDAEPVERLVVFSNQGSAVELALTLEVSGPDGSEVPAGMFTATSTTLTIGEGEAASVTLTANPSLGSEEGIYGGRLLASDGAGRQVTVPFAIYLEPESYELTLRHSSRPDTPSDYFFALLLGFEPFYMEFLGGAPDGADVVRRLPASTYAVQTTFMPADFTQSAPPVLLAAPEVRLTEDTLVHLDAALGEAVTLPRPADEEAPFTGATLAATVSGGNFTVTGISAFFEASSPLYYSAIVGPVGESFSSSLAAQWYDAEANPPALYLGYWSGAGGFPKTPLAPMKKSQTAIVRASYLDSLTSVPLLNDLSISASDESGSGLGFGFTTPLPLRRTEHLFSDDPGVRWTHDLWMHDEEYTKNLTYGFVPREFERGRSQRAEWNRGVFSARLDEAAMIPAAVRRGDFIELEPAMYSDGDGHAGYIDATSSLALYKDGVLIGETEWSGGFFEVPPDPGAYRVELMASQELFELSTEQRIVWSFESAHVPDGQEFLPLLLVHLAPELDARGRAERGNAWVPLRVTQLGHPHPRVTKPKVEVSYDDGASWSPTRVEGDCDEWKIKVHSPRNAQYVSLRAKTRDHHGNAVEQTIVRAYGLKGR